MILLIVDDDPVMLQNLELICRAICDNVHTASNAIDAEQVFKTNRVTHLICDYELGNGLLPGTALITGWKKSFPSLQKAILFTATSIGEIDVPPEVDVVKSKEGRVEELILELRR